MVYINATNELMVHRSAIIKTVSDFAFFRPTRTAKAATGLDLSLKFKERLLCSKTGRYTDGKDGKTKNGGYIHVGAYRT